MVRARSTYNLDILWECGDVMKAPLPKWPIPTTVNGVNTNPNGSRENSLNSSFSSSNVNTNSMNSGGTSRNNSTTTAPDLFHRTSVSSVSSTSSSASSSTVNSISSAIASSPSKYRTNKALASHGAPFLPQVQQSTRAKGGRFSRRERGRQASTVSMAESSAAKIPVPIRSLLLTKDEVSLWVER